MTDQFSETVVQTVVQTTPASKGPRITFTLQAAAAGDPLREVLAFEDDGRVFVRGHLVDTDLEIYEAFKDWLEQSRAKSAEPA